MPYSTALQEAVTAINQITSVNELEEVRTKLERHISTRRVVQHNEAMAQMHKIASSVGMSLADIVGAKVPKIVNKVAVKYRHPVDPTLEWSGRGRRKQWVSDWIAGGRLLSEIEVSQ
ncbi:H-NS histone family protein [Massilia sp. P8910]|uniref:H-NS histone family protein n=1 Tax=Massilia antarctica TaxID=2765360 RepID=UPI001E5B8138|nr:H-NS histone family protein [Massilia antarctica]MCE3602759.1 H-NS histone family protein [Massilia antarctica]